MDVYESWVFERPDERGQLFHVGVCFCGFVSNILAAVI